MPDEELAARVQRGDEAALRALMERYEGKLLRYGRRFLADDATLRDAVQDALVAAYQNIQSFDASRRFSPWLYRIAHNAFVDVLRAKEKEPLTLPELDTILPHLAWEDSEAREKEKEEMRVLVEKGVAALPPRYREVVTLYYFEDFSYQDIADILRVPVGTVGIRLKRARDMLKKGLGRDTP